MGPAIPLDADPTRMADIAFEAVERELLAAQRAAGTVPAGLRPPGSPEEAT